MKGKQEGIAVSSAWVWVVGLGFAAELGGQAGADLDLVLVFSLIC
jgi:hypothetical protein